MSTHFEKPNVRNRKLIELNAQALPVVGHTLATIIVCIASKRHLPHSVSLRRLLVVDGLLYLVAVDTVGMVQL